MPLEKVPHSLASTSPNSNPANTSGEEPGAGDRALTKPALADPDLARVIDAWPDLPAPIKSAVLVLVGVSK